MDRLRPRTTGSARGGARTASPRRRWPQGRSPHAPDLEPARHRANGRSPLRPRSPGPVSAPLRALRSGLATLPAHASCRNRDGRPVLSGILEASSSLRSSRAFCEALRERFPQGARASCPRESPGPDHAPAGGGPRFRPCTTCLADPGRRLVSSFQVLFMTLLRSGCQSSALSPPKGRGDHAEGSGGERRPPLLRPSRPAPGCGLRSPGKLESGRTREPRGNDRDPAGTRQAPVHRHDAGLGRPAPRAHRRTVTEEDGRMDGSISNQRSDYDFTYQPTKIFYSRKILDRISRSRPDPADCQSGRIFPERVWTPERTHCYDPSPDPGSNLLLREIRECMEQA